METRPPVAAERIVRFLTPPQAREEVLGDLAERYRSPGQYVWDGLTTIPFVIASQIRRSSSLPVLGLQGFILFACLGGFAAVTTDPPMWLRAAIPAAAAFLALVLRDAYRTTNQRAVGRAVVDGLAAVACVALTEGAFYALQASGTLGASWLLPGPLLILGVFAPLMLCLLRFGLGLDGERRAASSEHEIAQEYERFRTGTGRRNVAELVIGAACIALTVFFLLRFQPAVAPYGWAMLAGHIFAMLYIAVRGWVRLPPAGPLLVAQYQRELVRMRQIRQYLWWWYFVPLFVGLFTNLIAPGVLTSDMTRILLGAGSGILLCLCIAGLNHDRSRKVQEKVDALSAVRAA